MEPAIAKIYCLILEDAYKCSISATTANSASYQGVDLNVGLHCDEKKRNFYRSLPGVLEKMMTFWKNAPSSKSWALEKLSDVVCTDMVRNLDFLGEKDLAEFLNGFYDDDGKLLNYPDFIMDEVSKLLTSVLLSGKSLSENLCRTAFSLIRSAFDYGLINKGQRLHTVFQSFQKFLSNAITCDLLQLTHFDVSFALAVSLISGHNYTRKSAKDYFVKVIEFAFEEISTFSGDQMFPGNQNLTGVKDETKEIILNALYDYSTKLVSCCFLKAESKPDPPQYDGSIYENFCDVLCLCVDASGEWCKKFDVQLRLQHCSLFCLMLSLMKDLKTRQVHSDHHLTIFCIQMLIKLTKLQDDKSEKEENVEKLFEFIKRDLCQQSTESSPLELMQISFALISQCDCNATMSRTLLELSLLPLLSILGVPLSCRQDLNPKIVERFAQKLRAESSGNSPVLIDQAVKTAFELDSKKIEPHLLPVIDYVTMRRKEVPPSISVPFLNYNEIRNVESLTCIMGCFRQLTPILYNNQMEVSAERMICLDLNLEAVMNSTFKSHEHLQMVFNCFLATLHRKGGGKHSQNRRLVSSMTALLQLHMVSVSLTIREEAVKCVRELYLLDDEFVTRELADTNAVSSLWHCINDKSESVVYQVLDFILCAAKKGMLARLLSHMRISQELLLSEMQNMLLCNPWESVKSMAFSILSMICQPSDIISYAEASLALENHFLTIEVLRYMERLFKKLTSHGREELELLFNVIAQGWCDLLLSKVNAQDINAFRLAASILVDIHGFFMKPEVIESVNKMLQDAISAERDNIVVGKLQRNLEEHHAEMEKLLAYWEELWQSLKQLSTRSQFCQVLDCDSDEPPCKTLKFYENVSTSALTEPEIFLCSVAKCSKECVIKHYQHWLFERHRDMFSDEGFVDSTRELPPLKLQSQPFPSQELVHIIIGANGVHLNSEISRLVTILNVKEVLAKLNVHAIHREAHQSTDQYARNEEMILDDLNNQFETAFSHNGRHLKRQIAGILISDILDFLEHLLKAKDKKLESSFDFLYSLIARLSLLISSQKQVLEYIISKQKSVFVDKWIPDNSCFILDAFLKRLKYLHAKGVNLREFHSSATDLKCLLDVYIREHSDQRLKPPSASMQSCPKVEVEMGTEGEASPYSGVSFESIKCLLKSQTSSSAGVDVVHESIDSLQQSLDQMTLEESRQKTESIYSWLKRVCEITLFCLKESENVEENMRKMMILVAKMDHWYNVEDEDEFDEDNDPTLIDCF